MEQVDVAQKQKQHGCSFNHTVITSSPLKGPHVLQAGRLRNTTVPILVIFRQNNVAFHRVPNSGKAPLSCILISHVPNSVFLGTVRLAWKSSSLIPPVSFKSSEYLLRNGGGGLREREWWIEGRQFLEF